MICPEDKKQFGRVSDDRSPQVWNKQYKKTLVNSQHTVTYPSSVVDSHAVSKLVGGFNAFEKYLSNWIISPDGVKIKNIWNHHLENDVCFYLVFRPAFKRAKAKRCVCVCVFHRLNVPIPMWATKNTLLLIG